MGDANRKKPRLRLSASVEYAGFARFQPDRTLNVSSGGAFILTQDPLSVGKRLTLQFDLPGLSVPTVTVNGTVVWVPRPGHRHPKGMGVQFDKISSDAAALLDQYVMVTSGLRSLDTRIGNELPRYLRIELIDPCEQAVELTLGEVTNLVRF